VTAVAAGGGQSLALLSNGKVMAWGDNQYGQLGNGTTTDSDVPEVVSGLSDVAAVATGSLHSMALLSNGTVDTWGDNASGQLGDGTFHDRSKPGPVESLSGVTQISAGQQFSVALESDGEVQSWGLQSVGVSSKLPTRVGNLTGVLQISCGWTATLALLPGGKVDGWNELTGIAPEPVPVSGAIAVAAGGEFSLALTTNGTVQAWGDNALGQLGAGPSYPADGSGPVAVKGLTGATAISAGANHAVALVPPADAVSHSIPRAQPSIWQDVASPNPGAPAPPKVSDTGFNDLSADSASDAWAVGQLQVGLLPKAVAAFWDGAAWTAATLPKVSGMSSILMVAPPTRG
jgi:alpha-tubulin suppressor-like RCC1 family protein